MFKVTDKEIQSDISAGLKVFTEAKAKLERAKEKIHKYQAQKAKEREELVKQIDTLNSKISASHLDSAAVDLHMDKVNATISKIDSIVG